MQIELSYPAPFKGLTHSDMQDFTEARKAIYNLMIDGRWHNADEIISVSGQREGLRRLRELREWFDIDKKSVGNRHFAYKLKEKQ